MSDMINKMIRTKVEFAVPMKCERCVDSINETLSNVEGIHQVDVSLNRGTVIVETSLPYSTIQERIENSGKQVVFKGYGDEKYSAVTMFGGDSGYSKSGTIRGVIRFVQLDQGCLIDGTIDGLDPGQHGIHIHECGDISRGCASTGEHFNPRGTVHGSPDDSPSKRHVGDLGNVTTNGEGRTKFRILDKLISVPDIIGRSLVVTENPDDLGKGVEPMSKINGNSGASLACGIIARSSGLNQNSKTICACDGLTLWDERTKAKQAP